MTEKLVGTLRGYDAARRLIEAAYAAGIPHKFIGKHDLNSFRKTGAAFRIDYYGQDGTCSLYHVYAYNEPVELWLMLNLP